MSRNASLIDLKVWARVAPAGDIDHSKGGVLAACSRGCVSPVRGDTAGTLP